MIVYVYNIYYRSQIVQNTVKQSQYKIWSISRVHANAYLNDSNGCGAGWVEIVPDQALLSLFSWGPTSSHPHSTELFSPHLSVTVLNASVLHLAPAIIIYSTFCPPQRATAHREGYAFYLSLTKSWTDSNTCLMLIIIEKNHERKTIYT